MAAAAHPPSSSVSTLRLIMGDQLTLSLPCLTEADKTHDLIWMCEVKSEATHVRHHKKKIAFLFSAMRHFAKELEEQGYRVHYTRLDDPDNGGSFKGEIMRALKAHQPQRLALTEPSEYHLLEEVKGWSEAFGLPVTLYPDSRFLCSRDEFAAWAKDKRSLRMEFFYREMRKRYTLLMQGNTPEGGAWNYDSENRKRLSTQDRLFLPKPKVTPPDALTEEVIALVATHFGDHFGDLEPFYFAVTRQEALVVLERFIKERLPHFGDYQDAMLQGEPWLYHAHISFYINCGLLLPLEVVRKAEEAYRLGLAPLNAVEGFIRQIIGWREYVRGLYWLKMPAYRTLNFFDAQRPLPAFYWDGQTQMNCLRQCVTETKENAYAHHIQRLMVLGNFALLAGLNPEEVNTWYWLVYADAYEWVELPNVSGMILYADGGFLGSKPYAASGAYIDKMSDYCHNCAYAVKEKTSAKACPFNALYWHFMMRHQALLGRNPRLGLTYKTLANMEEAQRQALFQRGEHLLQQLAEGKL